MKFLMASVGVMILGISACSTPEPPRPPAASAPAAAAKTAQSTEPLGEMITNFGEHGFGDTIIAADKTRRNLTVKYLSHKNDAAGKSTTLSAISTPPEWSLHEGWFAYKERNESRVWLHNGAGGLLLVERKPTPTGNVTHIYGTNTFPVPTPPAVLQHLQEPLRSTLTR